MTVAIIGGAGFVGTRLAKVFDAEAVPYSLFDKVLDGSNYLDITKPETFDQIQNTQVVINLAAEHRDDVKPKSLYDLVNVEGSKNICQFCRQRGVNKIIFTSSVAVYGFAPENTDESGAINYFNDYGRTKYLAENVYREWFNEDPKNRTLVVIRPTVIFGEGNRGNVYNLIKQIANRQFFMIGTGENKKSMAYVQNVAEFIAYTLNNTSGITIHNYADKPDLTIKTLVSLIRSITVGGSGTGIRIPYWIGLMIGRCFDMLSLLLGRRFPISSIRVKKFTEDTSFESKTPKPGFRPRVSIEMAIERTVKYEIKSQFNQSD